MTRLLVLPQKIGDGSFSGGSYLRLLDPLDHLVKSGTELRLTVSSTDDGGDYDIAVIERHWPEPPDTYATRSLVAGLRHRGVRVVHTIDDNLYEHFLIGAGRDADTNARLRSVASLSRLADGVVVSTEALATVARSFNSNVFVYRNHPSRRHLSDRPTSEDNRVRVGYMGTYTHIDDFRLILPGLKAALKDEPQLSLEIIGVANSETLQRLLAPYSVTVRRPPSHAYDDFMRWFSNKSAWDIGIAPLAPSPINQTKSDIKALDYAMVPCATVASDVTAYAPQREAQSARVVSNSPEAWRDALVHLARNEADRQRLARAGRYHLEQRLMENHAHLLIDVIFAAAGFSE